MSHDNRRRRTRVSLGSDLLVRIGDEVLRAECVNVSMSGALLDLDLDVEGELTPDETLGRRGLLELVHRCGQERLAVSAEFTVVRVDQEQPTPSSLRMGIHFTGLDTTSSLHLFQLIRWQGG